MNNAKVKRLMKLLNEAEKITIRIGKDRDRLNEILEESRSLHLDVESSILDVEDSMDKFGEAIESLRNFA